MISPAEDKTRPDSDPMLASVAEESSSPPSLSLHLDEWAVENDGVFAFMEEDYVVIGEEEL